MTLIALHGVTGERGGRVLFAGIDLRIEAGGAVAVRGPNGAGKSSLLRMVAGLLPPAAGRIERSGPVAFLGERDGFDIELSLRAALAFWEAEHRCAVAMEALGLSPLADVPVRHLSTGQRRRAAMARVVASDASVWLLDEPANGLDAQSIALLERAIGAHRRSGGVVLVATHLPLHLPGAEELVLG